MVGLQIVAAARGIADEALEQIKTFDHRLFSLPYPLGSARRQATIPVMARQVKATGGPSRLGRAGTSSRSLAKAIGPGLKPELVSERGDA